MFVTQMGGDGVSRKIAEREASPPYAAEIAMTPSRKPSDRAVLWGPRWPRQSRFPQATRPMGRPRRSGPASANRDYAGPYAM